MSRNEVQVISSNSFKHQKKLKTLRLSENFIGKRKSFSKFSFNFSSFFPKDKIASDAFDSLMHLQCLYLKKNLITHVNEKHFRNLRNLIIVDLAANKIQSIHSNAFRSLTKVFELHLSQNFLKEIPENLFIEMARLKKLMLFSNDFRYLRSQYFSGLR